MPHNAVVYTIWQRVQCSHCNMHRSQGWLRCAAGNLRPLVSLMAEAESAEAQEHILKCLMQAPADTRAHFGGDLAAMTALNGWMKDLLATGRSAPTLGLALKVSPDLSLFLMRCRFA